MIQARFLTDKPFRSFYKRNNKAKGRKNLRCFPDCRATGHITTGYCGRPVEAEVTYDADAAKKLDLMAFGEFRPADPSVSSGVRLGHTFAFDDIMNRSRGTGHNPGEKALHPWFPGAVLTSSLDKEKNQLRLRFAFNKGNQGWHYAWQSQRNTRTAKHELHIFILAGSKQTSSFTCVCELSSLAFDIHCRRKRNAIANQAGNLLMSFANQTIAPIPVEEARSIPQSFATNFPVVPALAGVSGVGGAAAALERLNQVQALSGVGIKRARVDALEGPPVKRVTVGLGSSSGLGSGGSGLAAMSAISATSALTSLRQMEQSGADAQTYAQSTSTLAQLASGTHGPGVHSDMALQGLAPIGAHGMNGEMDARSMPQTFAANFPVVPALAGVGGVGDGMNDGTDDVTQRFQQLRARKEVLLKRRGQIDAYRAQLDELEQQQLLTVEQRIHKRAAKNGDLGGHHAAVTPVMAPAPAFAAFPPPPPPPAAAAAAAPAPPPPPPAPPVPPAPPAPLPPPLLRPPVAVAVAVAAPVFL
jgi:hypothetical protein